MCYFTRRDLEGHFEVRLLGLGGGGVTLFTFYMGVALFWGLQKEPVV